MSYSYTAERGEIFTEEGQETFLKIRDHAHRILKLSGAATMWKLISAPGVSGSNWTHMACVHRLAELGELRSIWNQGAGQDEVFVAGPRMSQ